MKKDTLCGVVTKNVEPGSTVSTVSTDELDSYNLPTCDGSLHGVVNQVRKEYSYYDYQRDETFHVNTVEGFWKLFKASVRSTTCRSAARTCHAIWTSSLSALRTVTA